MKPNARAIVEVSHFLRTARGIWQRTRTGSRPPVPRSPHPPLPALVLSLALVVPLSGGSVCETVVADVRDDPETVAFNRECARDINGDGMGDSIRLIGRPVEKGKNRVEAYDGKTGNVLWSASCWGQGSWDAKGRHFGWPHRGQSGKATPLLFDVNEDGLLDFIFAALFEPCWRESDVGLKDVCDPSIVALDHRTGKILWRIESPELFRPRLPTAWVFGGRKAWSNSDRLGYMWDLRRDFVLVNGDLLIVLRDSQMFSGELEAAEAGLMGVDPRTGKVLWRAPLPSSEVPVEFAVQDVNLNVRREENGEQLRLVYLTPPTQEGEAGGFMLTPRGMESVPGGVGRTVLARGLLDAGRLVAIGNRVAFAGGREVAAVSLVDGKVQWKTQLPVSSDPLRGTTVAEKHGKLLVFGWVGSTANAEWTLGLARALAGMKLLVTALAADSGSLLWSRSLDLPPIPLTVHLAEQIVIERNDKKKKSDRDTPRRIVLDWDSGQVVAEKVE